jgi:hypothetical protein
VLVSNGRIGWRWLVWHSFSHKNRRQRSGSPVTRSPARGRGFHESESTLRDELILGLQFE